jgi:DNA repair protein RadD
MHAPESKLKEFIGPQTLNILSALNPELLTKANLVILAAQSAEQLDMLRDSSRRGQLIRMLSLPKARELATKLAIRCTDAELFDRIVTMADDPHSETALRSFLGVVTPDRAPESFESSIKTIPPNYGLFPYQYCAAQATLLELQHHPYKVILHMPTGAGKTRTAMHVVSEILSRNPNRLIVWLAQSTELLEQAADEFEKAWSSLGPFQTEVTRYWGSHEPDIAQVRTGFLVAGLGKLHALSTRDKHMIQCLGDRAILTVIDEAHQAIAPSYRALTTSLHEKKPDNLLLGLTATPGRTWADIEADRDLAEFFSNKKVILKVEGFTNPVQFLIEQGYLARPTFRTLNVQSGFELSVSDLSEIAMNYEIPESVLCRLAQDEQRSIRIITTVEELLARHHRVILFASTVGHAHLLRSMLTLRGAEAFVVTATTDRLSRERMLNRFKSTAGKAIVICNYGVLTTGFDAPRTSAAVIARPTKSLVLFSQMVGRAIRGPRAGGNPTAEIVTVVDPQLPGFGSIAEAFLNWEDVWDEH